METANKAPVGRDIGVQLIREKLALLTKLRAFLVVFLLVIALLIRTTSDLDIPLVPLAILAVVSETCSMILCFVHRREDRFVNAVLWQLGLETVIVLTVIYVTGGISSPFAWLLALIVLASSLSLGATAGYAAAALVSVLFSSLFVYERLMEETINGKMLFGNAAAQLFSNIALCASVSLIAGFMSERFTKAIQKSNDRSRILAHISITDDLTGLYNQRYFIDRLDQEVARAERENKPLCLAFFDLDNFKEVNDTFGHQVGDELLRDAAAVISSTVRKGVDAAFRYGGDEMVVILGGADIMQGMSVVERIRKSVASMKKLLTFSIGIAEFVPGRSSEELLGAADHAMYEAKAKGGNAVVVSDWAVMSAGGT